MVPDRPLDPAAVYERERVAFLALLRSVPSDHLRRVVAATPAWTVRDVLAHVVGITADLNAQRFGDGAGGGEAWTAAQVDDRRDASLADLAEEWDREAPPFEDGLRLFGYGFGAHYLGDLLQHVSDATGALGRSPVRDDTAIAVALDFYLTSFDESLVEAAVGAVDVRVGDERWTLGTGAVVASVAAGRYELFRALGGRRTADEIRSLGWSGDRERIVGLVSRYPVPSVSLAELGA